MNTKRISKATGENNADGSLVIRHGGPQSGNRTQENVSKGLRGVSCSCPLQEFDEYESKCCSCCE